MLGETLSSAAAEHRSPPVNSSRPMMSDEERELVVTVWNKTDREYPREASVVEVFEGVVSQRSESVAVACEGKQLTYRELNERANSLAEDLRGCGVREDTLVGVCLERSLEMVVALLAVLKAGGAYVPLTPEYPKERLRWMVDDSGIGVLLTQKAWMERFPTAGTRVLCVDGMLESLVGPHPERPKTSLSGGSLAYVMYTSGSTGRPKGTMIRHRGIVRLVKNTDYASFGVDEVFLQYAPISFDASTLEIWGALLNGGRLVIMPPGERTLEELGETIRKNGVTTLWLTAGLFHVVVDERLDALRGIKQLLIGGDVLSVGHVRKAYLGLEGCRIINGYGPTENTTFTCCHTIESKDLEGMAIPIGRPIANTRIYILDEGGEPVPIEVAGELYAGGDGVGKGYWKQDALTAEKFVPDRFSEDGTGKLYRTGDLCRYRRDGVVEFLGRKDHQVKVRGFRIELGEIEGVLGGHPDVAQAVVVVDRDESGNSNLTGYVLLRPGVDSNLYGIKEHLGKLLPHFMLPSALKTVDRFPLTPNGKVDRNALAVLSRGQPHGLDTTGFVAPRTRVESRMATLWEELLGRKPIGVTQNFFDLGGNSLLAVRLFERMQKTLGRKLPLAVLFESPTIAQLARFLESEEPGKLLRPIWNPLVCVRSDGSRPPLFCVHGGGGEVLFARDLVKHLDPEIPFYGFQACGLENPEERDRTIEAMAENYLKALRSVAPTGPVYLAGYCMGGLVAYEMARRLGQEGRQIGMLLMIDTLNPIYMESSRALHSWKSVWLQKLQFQLGNLRRLDAAGKFEYLSKRSGAAVSRRSEWLWRSLTALWTSVTPIDSARPSDPVRNEELSRAVFANYRPTPTPLDVIIIRPENAFEGLEDPQMGWGSLVRGKLTVVSLPVNPGGMLVEPFIGMLGREVNRLLLGSQSVASG
jgi:amino acid adenylation domain-containing protein